MKPWNLVVSACACTFQASGPFLFLFKIQKLYGMTAESELYCRDNVLADSDV